EYQSIGCLDHARFQPGVGEARKKFAAAKWIIDPGVAKVRDPRHAKSALQAQADKVVRHRLTERRHEVWPKTRRVKARQCGFFRTRTPASVLVGDTPVKRNEAARQRCYEPRQHGTEYNVLTKIKLAAKFVGKFARQVCLAADSPDRDGRVSEKTTDLNRLR